MAHLRMRALVVATGLLAALAGLAPAATASPAASSRPSSSSTDGPTPSQVTLTTGANAPKKSGTASPNLDFFFCVINYGTEAFTPNVNSSGTVVSYSLLYHESDECDDPLFSSIQISLTDATTGQVLDSTPFALLGDINEASSVVTLPVNHDFVAQYQIQLTLFDDFIWVSTTDPANCLGIGTPVLDCHNTQEFNTGTGSPSSVERS